MASEEDYEIEEDDMEQEYKRKMRSIKSKKKKMRRITTTRTCSICMDTCTCLHHFKLIHKMLYTNGKPATYNTIAFDVTLLRSPSQVQKQIRPYSIHRSTEHRDGAEQLPVKYQDYSTSQWKDLGEVLTNNNIIIIFYV